MKAFRFQGSLDADPPEAAALWEHGARGLIQDGADVVAYFDAQIDLPIQGSWEGVDEVDYLAAYFEGLHAVDTGPLVIAPTHLQVALTAGQKPLWLDPGMAFGTGHHETTAMVLRALGRLDPSGKRVLDVGSGSGILAIAADLLGAHSATGIDNDPATVPVAEANARLNRSRAEFRVTTLDRDLAGTWDVVLANLFAELHVALMSEYVRVTEPGAALLLSGIADDKIEQVLAALPQALRIEDRASDGPWHLVELERR